jgi:DNA-binding response OmpR family regulator
MKIAIVDPSRTVRRIVGETVARWGYSALLFGNGEEALNELACNEDVGVLITSAELPGCSGLDLCLSARSLAANRPLYIILMSSFDEREKLLAALENGADDFI